jgi:hypothetical protein
MSQGNEAKRQAMANNGRRQVSVDAVRRSSQTCAADRPAVRVPLAARVGRAAPARGCHGCVVCSHARALDWETTCAQPGEQPVLSSRFSGAVVVIAAIAAVVAFVRSTASGMPNKHDRANQAIGFPSSGFGFRESAYADAEVRSCAAASAKGSYSLTCTITWMMFPQDQRSMIRTHAPCNQLRRVARLTGRPGGRHHGRLLRHTIKCRAGNTPACSLEPGSL